MNALANIRLAICFDPNRGSDWWKLHRDEVMAELAKLEEEKK